MSLEIKVRIYDFLFILIEIKMQSIFQKAENNTAALTSPPNFNLVNLGKRNS